ncbi:ferric reductase like transmembrane component-domain-containing protein [Phlebopus sp. FC_14]|nr:ferric reductase like transmembrane component-domain-containing protein [Phlebopus sp. FC_14]
MSIEELASSTTQTTSAATTVSPVDDETFVYHLDIFIFGIILAFALFNAPRAIAHLANRSGWLQGLFLRNVPLTRQPRINLNTNSIYLHSNPQKSVVDVDEGSTESFTAYEPAPYLPGQLGEKGAAASPAFAVVTASSAKQPLHVPKLSSVMHPVANVLSHRVHEGYSLGQVLLMLAYTVVILYAGLYRSDPFSDPLRAGWVATSQIPFVYALATKNNIIGILVGSGYEKLNYLHRLVGRLMVVGVNVHAIGYIYKWSLAGEVSRMLAEPYIRWGFVALVCFDLLGICSIQFVRSKSYNLFFVTHAVGLFVTLFAVCYHRPGCTPYVIAACVFYGLDHLARIFKTRLATATLRPIPELGLTRVEIRSLNAGWRAGQHVRLRILSTAMGLWGMTETHPFTIASVTKTDEGLVLMCKRAGRWTSRMYEIAATPAYGEQGREVGRDVKVMVEGPYGGVGNTVMSSYSGALFVVGGSGVTFALSAVQDLVQAGGASSVKVIDIIWSIPDPSSLTPMIPLLASLISQSTSARMRISVFYTRAASTSFAGLYLPPGITLAPGRPKIGKSLEGVVTSTLTGGGASGVFVGVCGPVALANNVADVVRSLDGRMKSAVGGVELHEEVFGW